MSSFFLKRNDYVQAEVLARKALEGDDTQPHYLALVAWLEALKPEGQSPDVTAASIAKLTKAIAMNEKCERAYFYRGQLHKRSGHSELAMSDFRKSVELEPRNVDSARELRLFEMRTGKSVAPPGKKKRTSDKPAGFFGRLFKK